MLSKVCKERLEYFASLNGHVGQAVTMCRVELSDISTELLSLREQLAELKALPPFKYTVVGGDGEDIGTTKSLSDAEYMAIRYGGNVVPLFTAAKPAGESNEPM
ncbi:hypothetical protein ACQL2C_004531 [Yersinia enterocolitica]